MKNPLYWLSRTAAVLFTAFISFFALDVFNNSSWPIALFMHLIPSFFLIVFTIIAWKHELLGGLLFLAAGICLLAFTNFGTYIIWLPAIIIGILFLLNYHQN